MMLHIKTCKRYFLKAEQIWKELVHEAPQVVVFKNYLTYIQQEIEILEEGGIGVLRKQIRLEKDTFKIYQLYDQLCDTLKIHLTEKDEYKEDLAQALNSQAWYGFFLGKFAEVEILIREAMALDTDNKYLVTNLAPALLLQGKFSEAKPNYLEWKEKPFNEQGFELYRDVFLDDLRTFLKAGIVPPERMKEVEAIVLALSD